MRANKLLKDEVNKDFDLIGGKMDDIIQNRVSTGNTQLNDGDIVVVNRLNNLIKISGEVSYPNIVTYVPGKKLNYYIRKAGGYMPSARKSKAVVIYPDGSAMGIKKFLIFKKFPKITSDAEIFVPLKEKSNRNKFGVGELAIVISALTLVTNTIISLKKN